MIHKTHLFTLIATAALVACGGGGSSSTQPGTTNGGTTNGSTTNGGTTNGSTTNGSTTNGGTTNGGGTGAGGGGGSAGGNITAAKLAGCPSESMSPADVSKLGCMVGTFSGIELDKEGNQTGNNCTVSFSSSGQFEGTFSSMKISHTVSNKALDDSSNTGSAYEVDTINGVTTPSLISLDTSSGVVAQVVQAEGQTGYLVTMGSSKGVIQCGLPLK